MSQTGPLIRRHYRRSARRRFPAAVGKPSHPTFCVRHARTALFSLPSRQLHPSLWISNSLDPLYFLELPHSRAFPKFDLLYFHAFTHSRGRGYSRSKPAHGLSGPQLDIPAKGNCMLSPHMIRVPTRNATALPATRSGSIATRRATSHSPLASKAAWSPSPLVTRHPLSLLCRLESLTPL